LNGKLLNLRNLFHQEVHVNRRQSFSSPSQVRVRSCLAFIGAAMLAGLLSGSAAAADCSKLNSLQVPGAEKQAAYCLDDLSTPYLIASGHTDASDWATLHSQATRNPAGTVPGIQIDGYFPDTSTTNGYNGWNHDAQFVIRLPDNWNGKLVVTGAPGVRRQYATDYLISDWVLAADMGTHPLTKAIAGPAFTRTAQRRAMRSPNGTGALLS
jgi:hypothetical protein